YDRFGRGGDHTAFNQEGYPGVRITTPNENFANQHTPTDTFANTSPTYAAKVTRVNAASAAALALGPRSPIVSRPPAAAPPPGTVTTSIAEEVEANTRRQATGPGLSRGGGYDAVLKWDYPDPEPDLAGFIVVVRSTTASDWEREIWAGN